MPSNFPLKKLLLALALLGAGLLGLLGWPAAHPGPIARIRIPLVRKSPTAVPSPKRVRPARFLAHHG